MEILKWLWNLIPARQKLYGIVLIVLLSCWNRLAPGVNARALEEKQEEYYQKAIEYIYEESWRAAESRFGSDLLKDYRDSEVLYNYAKCRELEERAKSDQAGGGLPYDEIHQYAKQIPPNYTGQLPDDLAEEINSYRKQEAREYAAYVDQRRSEAWKYQLKQKEAKRYSATGSGSSTRKKLYSGQAGANNKDDREDNPEYDREDGSEDDSEDDREDDWDDDCEDDWDYDDDYEEE